MGSRKLSKKERITLNRIKAYQFADLECYELADKVDVDFVDEDRVSSESSPSPLNPLRFDLL